jgi:3-dehydroquinate synthetase
LAEAAKTALLSGEEFLTWVEDNTVALRERDETTLRELIANCIAFKATVVAADPFEETVPSARMALNYGHTLGHVIEAMTSLDEVSGITPVPHGIAVAQGMRFAARLAMQLAGVSREFVLRQDALLDALGLPPLDSAIMGDDLAAIRDAFYHDKKIRDAKLHFVLLSKPGEADIVTVSDEILYDHLRAWLGIKLEPAKGRGGKRAKADEDAEEVGEEEAEGISAEETSDENPDSERS